MSTLTPVTHDPRPYTAARKLFNALYRGDADRFRREVERLGDDGEVVGQAWALMFAAMWSVVGQSYGEKEGRRLVERHLDLLEKYGKEGDG